MDWDFWVGIIVAGFVSIPLSILANLLTPRWQQWRATKSAKEAERQSAADKTFRDQANWFAGNPAAFQSYIQHTAFRASSQMIQACFLMILTMGVTIMVAGQDPQDLDLPTRLAAAFSTLGGFGFSFLL